MSKLLMPLLALLLLLGGGLQAQEVPPTVGVLQVADVLPAADSAGVSPDALIVVIFNRPVVALVTAEEAGDLPSPVTIDPPVQGEGEWINTSIYTFRAQPGLAAGQTYTVTVESGLTAADGAVLAEPFTWSFTTAAPAIIETFPENNASGVSLTTTIGFTFSVPVDRARAEAAFYLHPENAQAQTLGGIFEWNDDSTGFSFIPNEPLTINTLYAAGFAPDASLAAGGGAGLGGTNEIRFTTVPPPGVLNTSPFDGQMDAPPYSGFTIFFQSPMNPETLRDRIVIEPEPTAEYDTYFSEWNNSYTLAFSAEPSTDYTVTILPGMEDVYGNQTGFELVINFRTLPYTPDVSLQAPSGIGFYNAYSAQTQLFLTHRNVSQVDLELYRVPLDQFMRAVTGDSYYDPVGTFTPDPSQLLRSWSIESDTPENQRRYELLDLGLAISASTTCEGAPESRVRVGDSIRVIADAVRVRQTPVDGEILTVLYTNAILPITGGSTCANGFVWWEVELSDGRRGWIAEGDLTEYYIAVETAGAATQVTVSEGETGLPPGVYFLRFSSPETLAQGYMVSGHFLIVSDTVITTKIAADEVFAWVTDAESAAPVQSTNAALYIDGNTPTVVGTTDADGIMRVGTPRNSDLNLPRVVVIDDGQRFGIGLSIWSDSIDAYNFGLPADYYPEPYRTYLYTDRPIYRPDQPVYFRGIVRERSDVEYRPLQGQTVYVQITDEMGSVVYERDLPLTPFGTFSDTFPLAADAGLGYYRIGARLPGESEDSWIGRSGSVTFNVAEYRAPEFQVTVTPQEAEIAAGDTIRVAVDARYFFGGAVQNGTVEYTVVAEPYGFYLPDQSGYQFIDYDADAGASEFFSFNGGVIAEGTGVLDERGQLVIAIPAELEDATQSQNWRVEVVVTDESDQVVAGRTSVIVHKGLTYIGVQPTEYVATTGEPTSVNVITVDWTGEPVPNQTVMIEVVERRWSSVQELDDYGRSVWSSEVEEIPVASGDVVTDANGEALYSFTPPGGGVYKVRARLIDSAGNTVISAATLWVSSDDAYVTWRQQNSARIDLIADATDYQVGDTAEVLITSPFEGSVEALITVERGSVLSAQRVTLTSNSHVVEVPITADYAPNVFVTVMLIKGIDETNPILDYRYGMIQLAVDPEQKVITLDVEPNVDSAGPGDTVTFTVTAADYAGNPVTAEIGAGLTDLAVLTLADRNAPPLLNYFYGEQGLSVRTATPLTVNVDQITQTVFETVKGGGGGFGEGGIFDIREEFIDTAYWNAMLTTGADGTATFDVTLPDNLTTWRLDLRAVTSGEDGVMLVGETTFDLLSTKPLLIRPITPRFFVVGDQLALAAIVNNNTDADQAVTVNLSGTGLTLPDETEQTITIPAGGSQRVEWQVTVENVEDVDLLFTVQSEDGTLTDATKPPLGLGDEHLLPVYRYDVPETVGTGGALLEAGTITETIALPTSLPVVEGELTLRVDPSLIAAALESVRALENTRHESIEATVTRLFANAQAYRLLNGLMTDELRQQISQQVGMGVQRLYAWQKVDGGWGWFARDESEALMTAYALLGLIELRDLGFTVETSVIENAMNYLKGHFIVPTQETAQWQLNRQAFVLYVLARGGSAEPARTANLYELRAQLSLWARALLAVTLAQVDGNTSRADVLISDLVSAASISATGVSWQEPDQDVFNWNTNTRTTAMIAHALIQLDPTNALIPNVIRWLMMARTTDIWETTQETGWALVALADWSLASGDAQPEYTYTVALNADELAAGAPPIDPTTPLVSAEIPFDQLAAENTLTFERGVGNGALYYTAFMRAFLPVSEVEPLANGIVIERQYSLLDDPDHAPITEARVGDEIQVRLTIIAPTDLLYVVIDDPIPAGTDAVNPNLATSPQVGTQPDFSLDADDPFSQGWGWWWFSDIDFQDERVTLSSRFLPAGTYQFVYTLRAGLPGVYSVIPATAEQAYMPDVYARTKGMVFTVLPAE